MDEKLDILIQADSRQSTLFFPLLEKGCRVDVSVGVTVRELLLTQFEEKSTYVDNKIQTVFLNAKAIDDLDQTVINDGDVLALSGAMPGLVGATFRKGGKYAVMRKEISGSKMATLSKQLPGRICLKLFNTILKDLGPKVFAHGVWVSTADLINLLIKGKKKFKDDLPPLFLNKTPSSPRNVIAAIKDQEQCQLRIVSYQI
ncbi:MAG: hypothetical protein PVI90_04175 [Desulfobacteraceae bacterium]|jgi:hypothetical protein